MPYHGGDEMNECATDIGSMRFLHGPEDSMQKLSPAGVELASRIRAWSCAKPPIKPGRALDMGTGCGIVALTLEALGWGYVYAIDKSAKAKSLFVANQALNALPKVRFKQSNWNNFGRNQALPAYDWMFGADVLYDVEEHEKIAKCLKRNLLDDGTAVFLDPRRVEALQFAARLREEGFWVNPSLDAKYMMFEVRHDRG